MLSLEDTYWGGLRAIFEPFFSIFDAVSIEQIQPENVQLCYFCVKRQYIREHLQGWALGHFLAVFEYF